METKDIVIDVVGAPYETGFKFNTLPFGGMTIAAGNAVRIGSPEEIRLEPAAGRPVVLKAIGGTLPEPSEKFRGGFFIVRAPDEGIAKDGPDFLYVCLRGAGGHYLWHQLAGG